MKLIPNYFQKFGFGLLNLKQYIVASPFNYGPIISQDVPEYMDIWRRAFDLMNRNARVPKKVFSPSNLLIL